MKREKTIVYKNQIHDLIPGGAHTYSKGDDQFPENVPAAISHGKGAYVWDIDKNKFNVNIDDQGEYKGSEIIPEPNIKVPNLNFSKSVPLIKLAFARSGDKGDHANIGIIARDPEFLPYIKNALTKDAVAQYFKHVLKGTIECWDVPGINGLNFLLKNSLGGGGMASLNIDPQGKAYAQQLLEYKIPVSEKISQQVT